MNSVHPQKTGAIAVVIGLLALQGNGWAQGIPRADAVTFLGTEQSAAQLKKVVFAVQMRGNLSTTEKSDNWVPVGSGFFVMGTNSVLLGVTCKHVIAPFLQVGKEVFIGMDTKQGYVRFACRVPYVDPSDDVAVLAPQGPPGTSENLQNLAFSKDTFDDGSSIVEGRGVIIPGYPLALGIEEGKNHPVIRIGIVAQFTGKDYFLVDGIASHGNSGSPVFTQKAGAEKLIGMVTSHVADKITLFDENLQVTAQLPYNSGLSRCITMKVIQKALENALGHY